MYDEVTVVVIDDENLFRIGLSQVLDGASRIRVLASSTSSTALEVIHLHKPAVVLLDVRMPEPDGLQILSALNAEDHPSRIAMLTAFDEPDVLRDAIRCGASGLLLKSLAPSQLAECVRAIASGQFVLSAGIDPMLLAQRETSATEMRAFEMLIPREHLVLLGIVDGLSNGQIAQRHHLSVGLVKDAVGTLFGKLGVATRVEAAVLATRAGIGRRA